VRRAHRFLPTIAKPEGVIGATIPLRSRTGKITAHSGMRQFALISQCDIMNNMTRDIPDSKYAALAELRYRIRRFLQGSEQAAEEAGLEPQQYQLLLALRALPRNHEANIRQLADRLLLRHHSAVGLIDRLEASGYVRRGHSGRDLRQVCVVLLPRGKRALEKVVRQRLHELRGPATRSWRP
jgi:DNA-binding MarR family transcriptional regulator